MKTKFLLSLIISLITLTASAYDFMVDDIAYIKNSDGTSVSVTYTTAYEPLNESNTSTYWGNITIPEKITHSGVTYSVTRIWDKAFAHCKGLTSITIPNTVTSIGDYVFWYCTGLTSITIPNSVTSIGFSAFSDCSGLTSITIPNSVTSIGGYAFSRCTGLTSITIPESVSSIGNHAFLSCSGLTSITIPNSVTSIGVYAFSGCTGLTSITIPESVSSIDYYAFKDCSGLTSVEYNAINCESPSRPDKVWFEGCNLTSLKIGDKVKYIPAYLAYNQKSLTSITIPNSVTSIDKYAFSGCSGLTAPLTIPSSVTSIGSSAFYSCSGLTSVTVPNSITNIGSQAFYNCSSLEAIHSKLERPGGIVTYGSQIFDKTTTQQATLYIPEGTKTLYYNTSPWNEFINIEEEGKDDPEPVYADVDGNGVVDITDANIVINIILGK